MKNYALSPVIEDFTMMTSSKSKINVIFLVENCLSYNISKSGRKSITDKRDNLNWTKTKMTSSKKYIFVSLDANMMTLFHFLRVRVVWNRISNSCSFHPWYKNLIFRLVLELFQFQKWNVFANFCIILPIAARADFKLWRARTALWKVKSDWKSMEIVNCCIRNPNHVKILNFCHSFALRARTTRARTRTDGKFGNALNDLVRAQNCL